MQGFGADPEVFESAIGFRLLGLIVVASDAKQVARMDCHHTLLPYSSERISPRTLAPPWRQALLRVPVLSALAPDRATSRRSGACADDACHVAQIEVLHCVGNKDPDSVKAGVSDRAVENAASRPDERTAAQILVIAWLFLDEHNASVARPSPGTT
jgi:hypothetical protein